MELEVESLEQSVDRLMEGSLFEIPIESFLDLQPFFPIVHQTCSTCNMLTIDIDSSGKLMETDSNKSEKISEKNKLPNSE